MNAKLIWVCIVSVLFISCNIESELDGKGSISGATQTTNTISAYTRIDSGDVEITIQDGAGNEIAVLKDNSKEIVVAWYENELLDLLDVALYHRGKEIKRQEVELDNDSTGSYRFEELNPGSYTLKFYLNGDFLEEIPNIKVFADQETQVDTLYFSGDNPKISAYFENDANECQDGLDNDFDGDTDCEDSGCAAFIFCMDMDSNGVDNPDDTVSTQMASRMEELSISSNYSSSSFFKSSHELSSSSEYSLNEEPSLSSPSSFTPISSSSSLREIKITDESSSSVHESSSSGVDEESSFRKCSDNIDNDLDGIVDCDETSCILFKHCFAFLEDSGMECHDGIDNDGNGRVDCEDDNCALYCPQGLSQENSNFKCSDNLDNDGDGLVDCFDEDCKKQTVCASDDIIGIRTLELSDDSISFKKENYFGMKLFQSTELGSEVAMDRPLLNVVNCSYGKIFLSNEGADSTTEMIDMRNFFDRAYRFSMRTNCVSDSLLVRMSWIDDAGAIADSEPLFLNDLAMDSTVTKINNSEWHHFEVDFIRLGREFSSQLHSFTLVHCNESPKEESLMLEIDNMHFYGTADMHCVEVIHKEIEMTENYCQYDGQEILVRQKTINN